jgi:hypothetical protein
MKSLVTALAIALAIAFTALTVLAGQTDNSEGLKPVKTGTPDSYGHLTMAHPALWADHVGEFMKAMASPRPFRLFWGVA